MKHFISIFTAVFILLLIPFYSHYPLSAAPFGNYLIFNGGTINSSIPATASPSQFDAEVWIKPVSVSGLRNILTIRDASNVINYQVSINGSSLSLSFRYNSNSQFFLSSGNLVQNVWQKIGVSINSQETKLLINDTIIYSASGVTQLKGVGPSITVGSNYLGEMDNLMIKTNQTNLIVWNFDQTRGETSTTDSSGNNFNGTLVGGDLKIHYFGTKPTPTKFVLPTLPSIGRITIVPNPNNPPTGINPQPTFGFWSGIRSERPQYHR